MNKIELTFLRNFLFFLRIAIILNILFTYYFIIWVCFLLLFFSLRCVKLSEFSLILIIVFILFCLFVVLVERKFLAHAQRRFGPSIAGRNGYFQIILDLVKLATKELLILPNSLTSFVPALISLFFVNQILFIQNFIFAPSLMFLYNVDGVIFFHLILVMGSNIILIFIGFLSQSKYSLIGVFRGFVHVVSLDVYITVLYVLLVWLNSSGNFHDYSQNQTSTPVAILFSPLFFLFLIILLLESKRAPFDHVETETEVVAGYATEYSGIYLLTFYLVEYFHLIISANHFVILFLGGWVPLFSLSNLLSPLLFSL